MLQLKTIIIIKTKQPNKISRETEKEREKYKRIDSRIGKWRRRRRSELKWAEGAYTTYSILYIQLHTWTTNVSVINVVGIVTVLTKNEKSNK